MLGPSEALAMKLVDISKPQFKANPYPFYAELRAVQPVFQIKLPDGQTAWLITRYDDAFSALKDRRFSKEKLNASQRQPWMPKFFKPLSRNMLDLDDPDHERLRGLVRKAFTPKMVENMGQGIESLAEKSLDAVQVRGHMDVVRDYALPLPTNIIAQMLGVPSGEHHNFHRWSSAIVSSQSSKWGTVWAIPHVIAFLRYIRKLIRLRRNNRDASFLAGGSGSGHGAQRLRVAPEVFPPGHAARPEDRQGRHGPAPGGSSVLSYQGLRPTKPHENHSE